LASSRVCTETRKGCNFPYRWAPKLFEIFMKNFEKPLKNMRICDTIHYLTLYAKTHGKGLRFHDDVLQCVDRQRNCAHFLPQSYKLQKAILEIWFAIPLGWLCCFYGPLKLFHT